MYLANIQNFNSTILDSICENPVQKSRKRKKKFNRYRMVKCITDNSKELVIKFLQAYIEFVLLVVSWNPILTHFRISNRLEILQNYVFLITIQYFIKFEIIYIIIIFKFENVDLIR